MTRVPIHRRKIVRGEEDRLIETTATCARLRFRRIRERWRGWNRKRVGWEDNLMSWEGTRVSKNREECVTDRVTPFLRFRFAFTKFTFSVSPPNLSTWSRSVIGSGIESISLWVTITKKRERERLVLIFSYFFLLQVDRKRIDHCVWYRCATTLFPTRMDLF